MFKRLTLKYLNKVLRHMEEKKSQNEHRLTYCMPDSDITMIRSYIKNYENMIHELKCLMSYIRAEM